MLRTAYYTGGYIAASPAKNKSQEYDSIAQTFTTWDQSGNQTSQRPLTAQEIAAFTAADTANQNSANADTIRSRAQNALTANATYLAIVSPTNAQVAAQVNLLTKECSGIIRLLLNLTDTTSGT